MEATYNTKPEPVLYMPLPDGKADVWLRKDIQETAEDGNTAWMADEVYFRTNLSKESVLEEFESLFEDAGKVHVDKSTAATVEERLEAIEAAILEMVEVIVNG